MIDRAAAPQDQDDPTTIATASEAAGVLPGAPARASEATPTRIPFAHASEAEMARILDFYDVRWQYEPTTFPILWNVEGDVIESFAPDFYLPDLDMYLELTTLQQRLVRKKNRKLRRLRELYPDVRIKLFYARDFRAMMLKYGRLGLAASLSGSIGQLSAIRPPDGVAPGAGSAPVTDPAPRADPARTAAVPHGAEAAPRAAARTGRARPAASDPGTPASSPPVEARP